MQNVEGARQPLSSILLATTPLMRPSWCPQSLKPDTYHPAGLLSPARCLRIPEFFSLSDYGPRRAQQDPHPFPPFRLVFLLPGSS